MEPAVVVEGIHFEKDILKPGEALKGQVVLTNKGSNAHEVVCAVRGYDIYDRDFYRKEVTVKLAPGATSSVPIWPPHRRARERSAVVRADLWENGAAGVRRLGGIHVPSLKNRFDDYLAFSWGGPGLQAMKDIGFDALLSFISFTTAMTSKPRTRTYRRNARGAGSRLAPVRL